MSHYGLRVGNRVEHTAFGQTIVGEVIELPPTDNNRARIRLDDGTETNVVAEWCNVVEAPAKTPAEVAAEMLYAFELHQNCMWAILMRDGANAILTLLEKKACS